MKGVIKIIFVLLSVGQILMAQDEVYTIAKKMPEFPGGSMKLAEYLQQNTAYPIEAREAGYSGKCYVNFIVDTSGRILSPKIIKSSGHTSLDNEALRVVSVMPDWIPGSDSLKNVKVSMNIPVNFRRGRDEEVVSSEAKRSPKDQAIHEQAMEAWNEGHNLEQKYLFEKALEFYNKSLRIEPNNEYALFDKGKMLMVLNKKDNACEIWKKMIQDDIRKNIAEEYSKKYCESENGPEELAKEYRSKYNNSRASDYYTKALTDVRNGRYEAALKKFDSCIVYNPAHIDGLFNKGVIHYKLDQKNAACSTWKRLLVIKPEDEQTKDLVKKHCN